jgi:hypothetical protein
MPDRHQLFFGLRLAGKKFIIPQPEPKQSCTLADFFSAPANRKTGSYANREPNKQDRRLDSFLHEAAQNFELLSNIQDQKLKIKNI